MQMHACWIVVENDESASYNHMTLVFYRLGGWTSKFQFVRVTLDAIFTTTKWCALFNFPLLASATLYRAEHTCFNVVEKR